MPKKKRLIVDQKLALILIRYLLMKNKTFAKDLIQVLTSVVKEQKILSINDLKTLWIYQLQHNQLHCSICGNLIKDNKYNPLTKDHVIAKSKGGKSDPANLEPAHRICNSAKANMPVNQWEKEGPTILRRLKITINPEYTIYNYNKSR